MALHYRHIHFFLVFLFLLKLTPFLDAQAADQPHFARRIVWKGGENSFRFAVEIDRLENGSYQSHLRDFTTAQHFNVSLPQGEYRFRIVPHDILDRPAEASPWFPFTVRPPVLSVENNDIESEQVQVISTDDYAPREQGAEDNEELAVEERGQAEGAETVLAERHYRFNTLGVSAGSCFTDPLMVITVHGSYSPMRHLFAELGCDFGFISAYEDVEGFFHIYPFARLGFFAPFREKGGFFIGAGGGYQMVSYVFSYGQAGEQVFGVNAVAGINLGNVFTVSYTLSTDFGSASHKIAMGYTYRFK